MLLVTDNPQPYSYYVFVNREMPRLGIRQPKDEPNEVGSDDDDDVDAMCGLQQAVQIL